MVTLTIQLDGETHSEEFDTREEAVEFYSEGKALGLPGEGSIDGEAIEADPNVEVAPELAELFALIQALG